MREGWGPLCKFLDKPVPKDVAFPKTNDTSEMLAILFKIRVAAIMLFMVMPVVMIMIMFRVLRSVI